MAAARTLVIDTATAACSVALIEPDAVIAARHEVVGRGHAERLIPMVASLPDGGRADRLLVDVGPGSFTGIRVGIAAARGLALAWGSAVGGFSSLALVAAPALATRGEPLAVVLEGGHGEVFVQSFASGPVALDEPRSLSPAAALAAVAGRRVIGNGVRFLIALDPALAASEALPDAADVALLPAGLATLPPTPFYGRAPDAKLPAAR